MDGEGDRQTRRLQVSGRATYVVSLPKKWVAGMGLGAGDPVLLARNGDRSLTISPEAGPARGAGGAATARVGSRDPVESVRRRVIAMYLAGYSDIRVASKGGRLGAEQARSVRELVRSAMVGTEVVEAGPGSMRMQVLTRLPELPAGVVLERMRLMAAGMHREAVGALAAADAARAAEVARMDDEVDRFSLYMLRNLTMAVQDAGVLRETGLDGPADCLGYRAVVSRIERVADHAALIAKRVKFLGAPIDGPTMAGIAGLSGGALGAFDRAVESLARRDYGMAEEAAGRAQRVAEEQEGLMAAVRDGAGGAPVARFALDGIRRAAEYSSDIAEVVMDMNVRSVVDEG